jgi:thiamine-phosphate pyrophosphorylase
MAATLSTCELYAVLDTGADAPKRLGAALAAARLASVWIRPPAGAAGDERELRALIRAAQQAGAAALLGDAHLASRLEADGVHLSARRELPEAYRATRAALPQGSIVGVDPGIVRHDAMVLAEQGADYVAFGAPARLGDREKARARRNALIEWWAEIFETPCVAVDVETPEEAAALARAGADFIAVGLGADLTPHAARDLVACMFAAIRAGEAAS